MVYLALNKPRGVLSAMSDDRGRQCVGDWVADRKERLFHVGRLDMDSEGLLLLTNDGELANRLTHPSYGVLKTYLADVAAPVPRGVGRPAAQGRRTRGRPGQGRGLPGDADATAAAMVEVVVQEGRKHIVRRHAGRGRPCRCAGSSAPRSAR